MDWSKGYSSRFMAYEVDPITWKDFERVELISGSISKGTDALQQSANIDVESFDGSTEKWIRIYFDARQDLDSYHGAMFTGLASSPNKQYEGNSLTTPVQLYSVLKPLDDIFLQKGWFAAANADGVAIVQELLKVTPAPVVVDGSAPRLREAIIAEDNETNLTMAIAILDAIGWVFDIQGDGTIHLRPINNSVPNDLVTFSALNYDCLETNVDIEYDWFSAPNVYRAVSGETIAIARDDDPQSPISTVSRGREVWSEERDVVLNDNETLDMFAKRRLEALQKVFYKVKYTRRYHPDVDIHTIIGLNYPKQELSGYFKVQSQSFQLGHNAAVSEEAVKI